MKTIITLLCCLLLCTQLFFAQTHNNSELPTSINKDGDAPHPSALLDLQSDSKGVLIPRMSTAKRMAISNSAQGLLIFDTDTDSFWYFSNSNWLELSSSNSIDVVSENQKIKIESDITKNGLQAVDISGDYAVFGASGLNNNPGLALVYKWNGSRWIKQFELKGNNVSNGSQFGKSVSISNDYIAVGSNNKVYIYQKQGDSWVLQEQLLPTDAQEENFGSSVDIKDNQLIIGSTIVDFNYYGYVGYAYIYQKLGNVWNLEAKLSPNNFSTPSLFGINVSISGEFAIVADIGLGPGTGNDFGSVYIFRKVNNSWIEQKAIRSTDYRYFGGSINIYGDYILIDGYVYYWNGIDFILDTSFSAINSYTYVLKVSSLYGNYALVYNDEKKAILYERTSNGWKKIKELKYSSNMAVSNICIDNDKIIMLADNGSYNTLKEAYFFQK